MPIRYLRSLALFVVLFSNQALGTEELKPQTQRLLPMPKNIVWGEGGLRIDNTFTIGLTGHKDPRLTGAAIRLQRRLQNKTGIPLPSALVTDAGRASLEIHCMGGDEAVQSVRADESYSLKVAEGNARLEAPTPIGVLRGVETFLQLVELDKTSFYVPAVQITDEPRFPWRGLLIDVSRHWEPLEVIKRNLDAMNAVKMNVLHWHLSDDQGFRVESHRFPKLHQVASEGHYYTQKEVREVIAYARDRGIRVIPEFDMPGHTTAWLAAYPELASAPGPYSIERYWGVLDPCMDPTLKKLYVFLDSFIDEMAGLFPDEYFHIGGDEVNGKQWNASAKIQAFKARNNLRDNSSLQAYFNQRVQQILEKHDKKMIGWDEVLHPDLPKSVVVQSWRGHSYLAKSTRQGHAAVLSFGYYLDHMRPASFHYGNDPLDKEAAELDEQERSLVLGGEACMWAEFVNPDNIESRIWPRTAAIAERLWSPREVGDIPDMYRRLELISGELNALGLMHRNNQSDMLRRMAGEENFVSLKILSGLLKPTGLSVRARTRKYSSLVPLNRMVDAVYPESEAARKFADMVARATASMAGRPEDFPHIRTLLLLWKSSVADLKPVVAQSFLLEETGPLLEFLCGFIDKGLQALDYLESGRKPLQEWKEEAGLILSQADKPYAEMLIAVAPSLRILIEAAASLP